MAEQGRENQLLELNVEGFRSLGNVSLPLGAVNVLVGPNAAGKSNVLEVFRFLADVVNTDLEPAMDLRGGFDEIAFWGELRAHKSVRIGIKATWTDSSDNASPDEYELIVSQSEDVVFRRETFQFGRHADHRSQITASGEALAIIDESAPVHRTLRIRRLSSALSTLARLTEEGGDEAAVIADKIASFRFFDVHVNSARRPSRFPHGQVRLADDASNLAAFLFTLRNRNADSWEQLVNDAKEVLPQLDEIDFAYPSGAGREVVVVLQERGLRRQTQLADASFGTIRLLSLLALLNDPEPSPLACIEEVDHGLHPQALELLVDRIRDASEHTQFLIATHSPAFVDRIAPHELIICERRDDGSSAVPALSLADIERIVEESEGEPLGELWFSGSLGGDL